MRSRIGGRFPRAKGDEPMRRFLSPPLRNLFWGALVVVCLVAFGSTAKAADDERTNIHVVVTDRETGKPIYQARLTLIFEEETSTLNIKHSKPISYSAKTDLKGRYRFTDIPKGTVRLLVTAERHESFGRDFKIEKDNQVIQVKLKKPQPQL
jgi:Carboxypeptidase regulatory-like domain